MAMGAYGTSGLTGGLSPERKSYASHLTAALTIFALCVGAVCIAASMQVKPVEQQLVGEALSSSASSVTKLAKYDEAIKAQAKKFHGLSATAHKQFESLEHKSMALRKVAIGHLEQSEETRQKWRSEQEKARRLQKRMGVEHQVYQQLVATAREAYKKANKMLQKMDDLQDRAFKVKFKEQRLKSEEKTLTTDLKESHSFALKFEDQSVKHITRARAMKHRNELGHRSMMLRGASEMKNAYDESDSAKLYLHKLNNILPETEAYQKLLGQREEQIQQLNTSLLLAQVAEEKFENKKAVQRKVIKQLRSEMAAQAPVVSKLHDKFKAQKANYDSTKQKAYAFKETAKRARKEARMYRLKERMLQDQLVGK